MCAQPYIGSGFEGLGHPIRYVVESVASGTIGLDVNEIAPAFDGSQTAGLGAKLIRKFIAAKAEAKR